MQPHRQVIEDAPDSITIPEQYRRCRIELIIWPLSEGTERPTESATQPSFYDLTQEFCGCIEGGPSDLSTNPRYLEGFGE